jgi:fumarate reductase subunit D
MVGDLAMKRSNEPFFWLLFGAGGMVAALIGAGLVLTTGLLGPLGATRAMDYARAHAFAAHPLGKLVLFGVVALIFWHSVHRMGEVLHDAAHVSAAIPLRVVAALATLVCGWLLLTI